MIVKRFGSGNKRNFNPLNDFLFSQYMANSGCEKQLMALINAILKENNEKIINCIEIIDNKFMPGKIIGKKSCILDLRSKANDGRIMNLEVQLKDDNYFKRRSQLYISREFFNSFDKGGLNNLNEHILINILNFKYCDNEKVNRKFNMVDQTDINCNYSQCIKTININLIPFRKEKELDLNNELTRWLIFLDKNSSQEIVIMVLSKDKNIKTADEKIQELLEDEQFLHDMQMRQQADWKYEGEMAAAKEKAIKEGRKEGHKEGLKEGEDRKALEIANNLKKPRDS